MVLKGTQWLQRWVVYYGLVLVLPKSGAANRLSAISDRASKPRHSTVLNGLTLTLSRIASAICSKMRSTGGPPLSALRSEVK